MNSTTRLSDPKGLDLSSSSSAHQGMHGAWEQLTHARNAEGAKGVRGKHGPLGAEVQLLRSHGRAGDVVHVGCALAEAKADRRQVEHEEGAVGTLRVDSLQQPHVRQLHSPALETQLTMLWTSIEEHTRRMKESGRLMLDGNWGQRSSCAEKAALATGIAGLNKAMHDACSGCELLTCTASLSCR